MIYSLNTFCVNKYLDLFVIIKSYMEERKKKKKTLMVKSMNFFFRITKQVCGF